MSRFIFFIKFSFIFLTSILNTTVFAEKDIYVLNSHYKTSQTMFNLSDGSNYNTWTMKGSWTDNFSNFGCKLCWASPKFKKKDLSIYWVCEIKDEKKLKKWWTIERNVGVTEIGVGKSIQLAAEGYWSVLNGANCNYAIKHGEEYSYSITKCKITSNQAKILSNKIN